MDIPELKVESNSVQHLWRNEMLIDEEMFFSVITKHHVIYETTITSTGKFQLSFEANGLQYFAIVSEDFYHNVLFGTEKMTS
ncbi:hypothetical protein GMD78_12140 [Ornithinibacillus sp. L9]|uniref:Uncharacterized protein n=1 Tax=Ornithinibacillus caprae TaxID=2678566 RepID=A0A6N8FL86_9BACI|nr:hypothetical protein [Ornithinibacillus caprae]MUK89124.1 hypothetical protein [Ornithinibacillus caprae]